MFPMQECIYFVNLLDPLDEDSVLPQDEVVVLPLDKKDDLVELPVQIGRAHV